MAVHLFETLTLDDVTPQGLTTYRIGFAAMRTVHFTVEGGAVRYRYDGAAPTAAVGHLLAAGQAGEVRGTDVIRTLRFIAVSGAATVTVTGEAG